MARSYLNDWSNPSSMKTHRGVALPLAPPFLSSLHRSPSKCLKSGSITAATFRIAQPTCSRVSLDLAIDAWVEARTPCLISLRWGRSYFHCNLNFRPIYTREGGSIVSADYYIHSFRLATGAGRERLVPIPTDVGEMSRDRPDPSALSVAGPLPFGVKQAPADASSPLPLQGEHDWPRALEL